MATAVAGFTPVVVTDQVTARTVNWTVTPLGTTTGVVTTHSGLPPATIQDTLSCNPGDLVAYDLDDTNVIGNTPDSNILTDTVPIPPPTTVPTTPTALTLTFS